MRSRKMAIGVLLACAAFCFLSTLYGCGSSKSATGPVTITVWHWMTDREPAFKQLASRYEAATGVKVNFELYAPSESYAHKVRAAAQGNNLPDIFGVLGEKTDFASYIKAGHIVNLNSYMEADNSAWKNEFFPQALSVSEFTVDDAYGVPAGIYAVPIDIMTIQLLYNKKLFSQLGLDPARLPVTLQEWLALGKKIQEKGLQGFVSGWGELWMVECFANNYAFNIMGKDKVLATIRGEVPYTDPDWIRVLSVFKEMRDSGMVSGGVVTMLNKTAEQIFASEKSVFAFNGPWCVNVYKGMNPALNYGVMLPPKASESHPMAVWGGTGSSFMVNARSGNKEQAVRFLKWLTERDQQAYLSEATNNLPANKQAVDKIPDILADFAKGLEFATHPNVWGVSEFPGVLEVWDKGIQSIILAEKTPEQVAAEVQTMKQRELARKKH